MISIAILLAVLCLGYANGANVTTLPVAVLFGAIAYKCIGRF